MMKYNVLKFGFAFFIISAILTSCDSAPQEEKIKAEEPQKKSLNPNGDSELALLMRAMFDEAEQIKNQVINGEKVTTKLDHEKILSAHATEPEKANSPEFKAWAGAYLKNVERLKGANPENAETIFSELVSSCLSCHKALCPGPAVRIKKLKIPKKM